MSIRVDHDPQALRWYAYRDDQLVGRLDYESDRDEPWVLTAYDGPPEQTPTEEQWTFASWRALLHWLETRAGRVP